MEIRKDLDFIPPTVKVERAIVFNKGVVCSRCWGIVRVSEVPSARGGFEPEEIIEVVSSFPCVASKEVDLLIVDHCLSSRSSGRANFSFVNFDFLPVPTLIVEDIVGSRL